MTTRSRQLANPIGMYPHRRCHWLTAANFMNEKGERICLTKNGLSQATLPKRTTPSQHLSFVLLRTKVSKTTEISVKCFRKNLFTLSRRSLSVNTFGHEQNGRQPSLLINSGRSLRNPGGVELMCEVAQWQIIRDTRPKPW